MFIKKAVDSVVASESEFESDDLYVVWFAKTLQNWKALVSTDKVSGRYWEVTYNGSKKETYVDAYTKDSNSVIAD